MSIIIYTAAPRDADPPQPTPRRAAGTGNHV